jgi:organic hydroperoxide reductase OsmC/OhrA
MKPYPHHYTIEASATASGSVELRADGLPALATAPPAEFDGPGDQWSPESLLIAAVADCFVLTFRAIARASKLEWSDLQCRAEGTLDRVERVTRFVGMRIEAELSLPADGNVDAGRRMLEKAEKTCLVSNSLDLAVELEARVTAVAG